jgi:hypothetical protein
VAGRDVEFNYTASDKTGPAAASVEKRMSETGKKVEKGLDSNIAKGLIGAVGKVSPKLAGNLTEMFTSVAGKGGHILAAGIAVASPLIGATVSAAVIGGVGIGGVIGGVALVADNPAVKAAGKRLGTNLMSDLKSDAGAFVEPVLRNIGKIEGRFEQMRPKLNRIFTNSSGFLDPLVDGALRGIDSILAGADKLIAKAGPVMDSIGRGIGLVGDSIGQAFMIIGDGSEDAASALDLVFRATANVITNVALLIRGLTELYGLMDGFGSTVNDTIRGWVGMDDAQKRVTGSGTFAAESTNRLSSSLQGLIPGLQGAAVEAGSAATEYDRMKAATDAATNANRALYGSQTDIAEGFAKASQAIRDNGRNVDVNTEKGRANRKVLEQQAGAIEQNYKAFIAVNGVGPQSAAVADNLRAKFEALGRKAGYSAGEARNLANKILGIPQRRETKLIMETAAATAKARSIQSEINKIPSTKYVRVIVTRSGEVTYGGGGGRQAPQGGFDANSSYRLAARTNGGVSRTGGAGPVTVNNDVRVMLDGAPFYAHTTRAVAAAESRAAWRQKVGRR